MMKTLFRPSRSTWMIGLTLAVATACLVGSAVAAKKPKPPRQPDAFATHGGHRLGNETFSGDNRLYLAAFVTPATGTTFNKITTTFYGTGDDSATASVGIYDIAGNAIALSDSFVVQADGVQTFEIDVRGHLEANSIYVTGWGVDGSAVSEEVMVPDSPLNGYVENAVVDGLIPDSFNPEDVVRQDTLGRSLTLTRVHD